MSPFEHRKYTSTEVRKAGNVLRVCLDVSIEECKKPLSVLVNFRALHYVPLNTFQAGLRVKLKKFCKNAIVAQRIKRLPTILHKLKRFEKMHLDRMQDIGGIRAIVDTMNELKELRKDYLASNKGFAHELVENRDYIECPKSSGYRGYHLVYKYYSKKCPPQKQEYKGLRIELQLRTKLQHVWATAVETFEAFLGDKFKSSKGDDRFLDFFKYLSSSFALMEGQAVLDDHKGFSQEEIYKKVAYYVKELNILQQIKTFSQVSRSFSDKMGRKVGFGVLILDTHNKVIYFTPYSPSNEHSAYEHYSSEEESSFNDSNRLVVLVKADSIDKLKKAYPNYFADLRSLHYQLKRITESIGH